MTSQSIWDSSENIAHHACAAAQRIHFDAALGLLSIEHDGSITWDELQAIKDQYFGAEACAIEVYPPHQNVVNNISMRHLWLLGPDDWWPDLGREGTMQPRTLRERYGEESRHG